jgi:organic hydroperoxide reductase OsmC/OhrA
MEDIEIACPPEFGGHPGFWTPEHLFVSSVEVCVMTTFLSLFQNEERPLVSYESRAVGRARIKERVFRFTDISIEPRIVVEHQEDVALARTAIERAADQCLISRALDFKPTVRPVIECARSGRKGAE